MQQLGYAEQTATAERQEKASPDEVTPVQRSLGTALSQTPEGIDRVPASQLKSSYGARGSGERAESPQL